MKLFPFLALVYVPMAGEALYSSHNERRLRQQGAWEPPGDVFRLMQVSYPAAFAAMIAENWWRGAVTGPTAVAGALLFAAAKILKYASIAALGPRWTFRVLVPPGSGLVATGPYRVLRHPNYVAVLGELAGIALLTGAAVTGLLSLVVFGALIAARIRIEERALGIDRR